MYASLFLIGLLVAMSPGPDFVLLTRLSLSRGRTDGFTAAFGVGLGLCAHTVLAVTGAGWLLTEHPAVFAWMRSAGAAYLVWLGIAAIRGALASWRSSDGAMASHPADERAVSRPWDSFRQGLLCNLLNPKAVLFFLSVFSQYLDASESLAYRLSLGIPIVVSACLWFLFLAWLLDGRAFRRLYARIAPAVDGVLGVFLNYFGVKLLLG